MINKNRTSRTKRALTLLILIFSVVFLQAVVLFGLQGWTPATYADPIEPPEGYPKLSLSSKSVAPTLAAVGGEKLTFAIEIRNTGAYAAKNTLLSDSIPANTNYNGDAWSSVDPQPTFSNGKVQWKGDVGFDSVVAVTFSVNVKPAFEGIVQNTAEITHPMIEGPVFVTDLAVVTDDPYFLIGKTSAPAKPGASQPLTYTLVVTNLGQPADKLPIVVRDEIPDDTTINSVGPDGSYGGGLVTWNRDVTLATGDVSIFTFVVDVGDVPSGTIITNDTYQVSSVPTGVRAGPVHTTAIVDPILFISKEIWPDPPGSNSEVTYILTVLNKGSQATNLSVTDIVPDGVDYVSGGDNYKAGTRKVSWSVPSLDTNESTQLSYVVSIGDVADIPLINSDYKACAQGVCQQGDPLISTIHGAAFLATAEVYPIAKKPGGGTGPVTPTLTIENLGPGNARNARALLQFERISVSASDLTFTPNVGAIVAEPDCGEKCASFVWKGHVDAGQTITFTTITGQSTIGGGEGTNYTATVVISDKLANTSTQPITATASGKITHYANLIPIKTAPAIIGRGQLLTYDIRVWNSALTTDTPPFPVLTDTVPLNTTFVSASDGGVAKVKDGSTVVSWSLPAMSTGEELVRSFKVRVDSDLVSGTQIINGDYATRWYEPEASAVFSNAGEPVITTVREVGLIDSYKEVTPTLALPGTGNILTYNLHIVNSSPVPLKGVEVYDYLPWESTTYQRDAQVSAGTLNSDIVSVEWKGSVDAFSEETIKMTVLVDPGFEGPVTNTAIIDHPSLLEPVAVEAVAYITFDPVLMINKSASPDPVTVGDELLYNIRVTNLGQQATGLIIIDTVPSNGTYVAGSGTAGASLADGQVRWQTLILGPHETRKNSFRVTVGPGKEIVNDEYGVTSAEGISATGPPVTTAIRGGMGYLPSVYKQ